MTTTETTFVAIDPATGCHLREATDAERDAYLAQDCPPGRIRWPLRVGNVLVDEDFGFGVNLNLLTHQDTLDLAVYLPSDMVDAVHVRAVGEDPATWLRCALEHDGQAVRDAAMLVSRRLADIVEGLARNT